MSDSEPKDTDQPKPDPNAVPLAIGGAVLLIVAMIGFSNFDWPSGRQISITDFVIFWFREIIFLFFIIVGLIVFAFEKKKPNKNQKEQN
jgi:hypothetical protein